MLNLMYIISVKKYICNVIDIGFFELLINIIPFFVFPSNVIFLICINYYYINNLFKILELLFFAYIKNINILDYLILLSCLYVNKYVYIINYFLFIYFYYNGSYLSYVCISIEVYKILVIFGIRYLLKYVNVIVSPQLNNIVNETIAQYPGNYYIQYENKYCISFDNHILIFSNWNIKIINDVEVIKDKLCDEDCTICINKLSDIFLYTKCNHKYCFTCLMKWLEENSTCPVCRKLLLII